MQYYTVKNWQKFQHYKDRNPPWIKLHYEIMTSADWVMLADASKLLAVVCMLVASRNEGKVPADSEYLRRVAYLNKRPDFKPLIDCGFLSESLAGDSRCKRTQANATTETEADSTEEDKKEIPVGISQKERRASRLPEGWILPQEWGEWAETQGLSGDEILLEAEKFRDYWHSTGKAKVDWLATWRNWIRKHIEDLK